jgi:hypothetical protein
MLPRMCGLNDGQRREGGCPKGTEFAEISHAAGCL